MIAERRRPDPRLAIRSARRSASPSRRARSSGATPCASRAISSGAWIARRWRGRWYGARIVETEAYLGAERPRGALLGRPAHAARRADVRGRRAPLRLPRLRHAPLRQRRHAARGRRRRRSCCAPPRAPDGAPARLLSGPGQALRRARDHDARTAASTCSADGPVRDPSSAPARRAAARRLAAHRRRLRGRGGGLAAAVLRRGTRTRCRERGCRRSGRGQCGPSSAGSEPTADVRRQCGRAAAARAPAPRS